MALTFRTPVSSGYTGTTFLTLTKPTGTSPGDLLLVSLARSGNTAEPYGIPSGWGLVPGTTVHTDIASLDYVAWYCKVAGASEPANYTWSWDASVRTAGQINCGYGDINQLDPFGGASDTVYNTSDTSVIAASFNVTQSGSHLVHFAAYYATSDRDPSVPIVPANFTNISSYYSASPDLGLELNYLQWSGNGATGAVTSTLNSASNSKHAYVVALNPIQQVQHNDGLFFGMGLI